MVMAQEGKSVVSSCLTKALRPWDFTSSAVASAPAESECHVIPTSMPFWARATAVALPMPESEAVTMAYRGSKLMPQIFPAAVGANRPSALDPVCLGRSGQPLRCTNDGAHLDQ